eukprot:765047-Hanusia_phi.AAC.4
MPVDDILVMICLEVSSHVNRFSATPSPGLTFMISSRDCPGSPDLARTTADKIALYVITFGCTPACDIMSITCQGVSRRFNSNMSYLLPLRSRSSWICDFTRLDRSNDDGCKRVESDDVWPGVSVTARDIV